MHHEFLQITLSHHLRAQQRTLASADQQNVDHQDTVHKAQQRKPGYLKTETVSGPFRPYASRLLGASLLFVLLILYMLPGSARFSMTLLEQDLIASTCFRQNIFR